MELGVKYKMIKNKILDINIATCSFIETTNLILEWSQKKLSKYICICNTHSLVTSKESSQFKEALENADLCTADGMPLVWASKINGHKEQQRVDGPNLMLELCRQSVEKNISIFLYGSTPENLKKLKYTLELKFKGIHIVGILSPPFRDGNPEVDFEDMKIIKESGANLIFVALGCPKQELWMSKNYKETNGVMIGVGAAFDFINGNLTRPPLWVQKIGMEWMHRLTLEPKRLFKRYAYNNSKFIFEYSKSLLNNKK